MKYRVTKQVRVGLEGYKFARKHAKEYGVTLSKVMDQALRYFSGEHQREKEESEAEYKRIFPDGGIRHKGKMVPITAGSKEVSTILKDIQRDMRTGAFWTSPDYAADNERDTQI